MFRLLLQSRLYAALLVSATTSLAAPGPRMASPSLPNFGMFRPHGPSIRPSSATEGADSKAVPRFNTYTFTEIPIPGAVNVFPWDINNAGDVAGSYLEASGDLGTFYRVKGVVKLLKYSDDHPGSPYNVTSVSALNEESTILAGNWGTLTTQKAGYYVIATKEWVELPDIPGYRLNYPSRLLPSGLIPGYACKDGDWNFSFNCFAWLWDGARYIRQFSFPASQSTYLYDVNSSGEAIGVYFNGEPSNPAFQLHAFAGELFPRFRFSDFVPVYDGFVPPQVSANGINDEGIIVGGILFDEGWRGYIYDHGFIDLLPNFTPADSSVPIVVTAFYQINNSGQILGAWLNGETGAWTMLMATPKVVNGR